MTSEDISNMFDKPVDNTSISKLCKSTLKLYGAIGAFGVVPKQIDLKTQISTFLANVDATCFNILFTSLNRKTVSVTHATHGKL